MPLEFRYTFDYCSVSNEVWNCCYCRIRQRLTNSKCGERNVDNFRSLGFIIDINLCWKYKLKIHNHYDRPKIHKKSTETSSHAFLKNKIISHRERLIFNTQNRNGNVECEQSEFPVYQHHEHRIRHTRNKLFNHIIYYYSWMWSVFVKKKKTWGRNE